MFGSLKEKLKNWTSKIKEEVFGKEELEKTPKKTKKKTKTTETSKKKRTPKKSKTKSDKTSPKKSKPQKQKEEVLDITPIPSEVAEGTDEQNDEQEIEKEELVQEVIEQDKPEKKKGFFSRLFKSELSQEKFEELFQELELQLLENNVAYEVVEKIKQELSLRVVGKNNPSIEKELKEIINEILIEPPNFFQELRESLKRKKPFVIALVGINGSGKTTTIAKLAYLLKKNNFSVCLAAADTYRAASIEQIEAHAKKLNISLIKKDYGTDPASVGFEAIAYAKKNNIDVVLIDTAGRLNNKESLMRELEKIIRVTNPDMKLFTGESTTGNDATEQARTFNELIDLTGIILSKADIDEKGGTMISVGYITKKPILFLGTGQEYSDLEIFKKDKILTGLGL